jgi:signal transduction histidine kinase
MRTRQRLQSRTPGAGLRTVRNSALNNRETALKARVAELEQELRARDDFLAIAAHELGNPMTPIGAQVELLLSKAPEAAQGALNGFVPGLRRLQRLVDAYLRRATVLLEGSRISSGNLLLQIAQVNLTALVRQVVTDMIPLAERAGCRVRLTVQEGIIGRCDAMAMEQVSENLLSNAVRYGPEQPIEVALTGDGHVARLSVRDEGIGSSERDQAQIFERFHTLPRIRSNGGLWGGSLASAPARQRCRRNCRQHPGVQEVHLRITGASRNRVVYDVSANRRKVGFGRAYVGGRRHRASDKTSWQKGGAEP